MTKKEYEAEMMARGVQVMYLEEELFNAGYEAEQETNAKYHDLFARLYDQCMMDFNDKPLSDREKDLLLGKIQLLNMLSKTRDANYTDAEIVETNMVFTLGGAKW